MVKYLLIGAGYLGNRIHGHLKNIGENSILLNNKIGQYQTQKDIKYLIREYAPDIVINCIGKTGGPPYNNIDWCQDHKEETFFSNVTVPSFMAESCEELGMRMVHIGSGCIFEGCDEGNSYGEYDRPNFLGSWYSKTKIFSEEILTFYNTVLILRIRMPIDIYPGKRNLIDKLIGYRKVIGDVKNSMTYVPDFLKIIVELMNRKYRGIYNVVNDGVVTHREILELYKEIVNPSYEMPEIITTEELKKLGLIKAGRSNCILSVNKLKEKGIEVRNIKDALREGMYIYKINLR